MSKENVYQNINYLNPLVICPEEITKESITKRLKEVIEFKRILNEQCSAKDILNKLCTHNNLKLSDTDKEDILSNLE